MGLTHSPKLVTDGLVLCLDAANPRSYPGTGTVWKDISGNGNDATLMNSPLHQDGLFKFDGTSSYADTNYIWSDLYLGGSFMVLGFNSTRSAITHGHHSSRRFYWDLGAGGLYHGVQDKFLNGASHNVPSGGAFSVASTYGGGTTADLYVNGTRLQTMTGISNSPSFSPNSSWTIAAGRDGSGNINAYGNHQIGIVLFYNREITPEEIEQNHQAFRGRYGL